MISTAAAGAQVSPGRNKAKRKAVLDAATQVFVRAGYGAATMDEIAREANVSKQTIYHHFGSKEALFGSMVSERCQAFIEPLDIPLNASGGFRATLRDLGRNLLDMALSPASLALHRLIIGESARFPELGLISYESGVKPAVAALARYFQRQIELGRLRPVDAGTAAEQFLGLLMGHHQLRALLAPELAKKENRQVWVDEAVDTFMCAHGLRG